MGAEVTVKTSNPACASSGPGGAQATGWYVAWRATVGAGVQTESGVAHSAGEGLENTSEIYGGTVTTLAPSIEVHLQLRAWHNNEYRPDGTLLAPADVSFDVEIADQLFQGDFGGVSSEQQGSWDDAAPYWRVVGTFDFSTEEWHISGDVVSP